MVNLEELTDFYYFLDGKIYFSKYRNTRKLFQSAVVFALKDGLFICIKNRYDGKYESVAFITRKGFIDYVQGLYDQVPYLYRLSNMESIFAESLYRVNENSPIHLIKTGGNNG